MPTISKSLFDSYRLFRIILPQCYGYNSLITIKYATRRLKISDFFGGCRDRNMMFRERKYTVVISVKDFISKLSLIIMYYNTFICARIYVGLDCGGCI